MRRFIVIVLFLAFMVLLSATSSAVPGFVYQGHIKNSTGAFVGGANVSVNVVDSTQGWQTTYVWSNLTNASGFFQITVWNDTITNFFRPVVRIYSGSTVIEIGPTLPEFPSAVFSSGLNNSNMTTVTAATFNLTTYI